MNKCGQFLTKSATAVLLTLFILENAAMLHKTETPVHTVSLYGHNVVTGGYTVCLRVSYWPTVTLCTPYTRHIQGSGVFRSHSFSLRFNVGIKN